MRVDRATGDRTVLVRDRTWYPTGCRFDLPANIVYAAAHPQGALVAVDLSSNEQVLVSR
jgi:hypothetical protein